MARRSTRCPLQQLKEAEMKSHSGALLIALITTVCTVFEADADELAGTSWRLVRIMSMDDRVHVPEERAK